MARRAIVGLIAFASSVGAARADEVLVVKRAGVAAYEELASAFMARCRARLRAVNLDEDPLTVEPGAVVLAIGQQALDAVWARAGEPAATGQAAPRIVSALALRVPPGVLAADAIAPPLVSLRALKAARPSAKQIGVVHGPHTDALFEGMVEPARELGLTLVRARAADGPGAVRALHRIEERIDAVWLAPDLDVLAPQLFQYALMLQVRRAIPLVAVTRQQVRSGALIAVDADPKAVGAQAAGLVNRLLDGISPAALAAASRASAIELVVNGEVARRLGVEMGNLRASSWVE